MKCQPYMHAMTNTTCKCALEKQPGQTLHLAPQSTHKQWSRIHHQWSSANSLTRRLQNLRTNCSMLTHWEASEITKHIFHVSNYDANKYTVAQVNVHRYFSLSFTKVHKKRLSQVWSKKNKFNVFWGCLRRKSPLRIAAKAILQTWPAQKQIAIHVKICTPRPNAVGFTQPL